MIGAYFKTIAKLLLGRGVSKSYGHSGEDAVLQAMLKWVKHGTYVDVGAYHPVLYSNTYALYKKGWKGIVIDPNPEMKQLYSLMRPRDRFIHAATGAEVGEKIYHMFEDGAYNTFDPERAAEWETKRHLKLRKKFAVSFKPLAEVVRSAGITQIDFMNVDVEGMDLEVLKTHDWALPPRIVAVEDEHFNPEEPHTSALYSFLHEKGYVLAGLAGLTLLFKKA